MPPLPITTWGDQGSGADEARVSVSNLVQKFEAERRKKTFLAQKAFSSSDALGSPSAAALGEDVSPRRAALDDNHLHLGHQNRPSPLSASDKQQHGVHGSTGIRNGGVAQPPQPLKRIDTAAAAGLDRAYGPGTSTATPSSTSSAFASAISARAAELRQRGAAGATPSITPGHEVDTTTDPAVDPLPLFKKVNGRWIETPASVAYFQSRGTLEAPEVGGEGGAEAVTATAATCGTDNKKPNVVRGNDDKSDGSNPALKVEAEPGDPAVARGAPNLVPETDAQVEQEHKASTADAASVTRPFGVRPAALALSVKLPPLTVTKGSTTTAKAERVEDDGSAAASTRAEPPSPWSDCGDRPASAAPPSSAGTASSLQSALLSADSGGCGGSSGAGGGPDVRVPSLVPSTAAGSSGRGLSQYTTSPSEVEERLRDSSLYTAPSVSSSWAPTSRAASHVSEHGAGPSAEEGESRNGRGLMSRLEELMRSAEKLEGGDGLDESPIRAAGGWSDDEEGWSQGDCGDEVDDVDGEVGRNDGGGVGSSSARLERPSVSEVRAAVTPALARNPAVPREWGAGPVAAAAQATQSRDNQSSLEKVGAISGVSFRLFVSQGMLYALSAKGSTIIHPNFPIDLERILSAVPLQRRVVVVFLGGGGGSGRPKTEVSLMDVEIDFQSDSVAAQWSAKLDAVASKDNVSGVTGKQAIVLADQQDKKAVSDVLKKQVIPILNLARKPFDIIPVEFSQACIEETLRSLPMKQVNAVACITTRKSSPSHAEEILLRVAKGLGLPQDSIRVVTSPKDAVELSLAMVK
ncbi:hypothetical protein HK405_005725, partial [Cladochytrium tenue]